MKTLSKNLLILIMSPIKFLCVFMAACIAIFFIGVVACISPVVCAASFFIPKKDQT